ncbi:hypothetical protein ACHAXS_001788 [Conticribra weissflogii]
MIIGSVFYFISKPIKLALDGFKNNDPSFQSIVITLEGDEVAGDIVSDDDISKVGRVIGNCSILSHIEISVLSLNDRLLERARRELELLCNGLQKNKSIKNIYLTSFAPLGDEAIQHLAPFLENSRSLNSMWLKSALTQSQFGILGECLVKRQGPLGYFLCPHECSDESLRTFLRPFQDNPGKTPKVMHIRNDTGLRTCREISQLLQKSGCSATKIFISNLTNEDAALTSLTLAEAVRGNKKLETLSLPRRNGFALDEWGAFLAALCDTKSIKATYESNHTLRSIGSHPQNDQFPGDLTMYLSINEHENKALVARFKIIIEHFDESFDMELLEGYNPGLLVKVVEFLDAWLAEGENRDKLWTENTNCDLVADDILHARFTIIYHLVKLDPLVFGRMVQNRLKRDASHICH